MIHHDYTVQVNAGRNIGGDPMIAERWNEFREELREAVDASLVNKVTHDPIYDVLADMSGYCNQWREDSFHFVVGCYGSTLIDLDGLCRRVQWSAQRFGQMCISVTYIEHDERRPLGIQRYVRPDGWE